MSASEEDIAAALDDIGIDNLVSLLQNDTVFHDLNKLDLPPLMEQSSRTTHPLPEKQDVESCDDDFLEFHDAIDFFPADSGLLSNGTVPQCSSLAVPAIGYSNGFSNPSTESLTADPDDPVLNSILTELLNTTDLGNITAPNGLYLPQEVGPLSMISPSANTDLATRQSCVKHDHTYASNGTGHNNSMLTTLSREHSDTVLCESGSTKNSDCEEGTNSDIGVCHHVIVVTNYIPSVLVFSFFS